MNRTKAAKLKAKRGRPRLPTTEREPNGRKSRRMDAVTMREETAISEMPAVQRRIRQDNILPFKDKSGKLHTAEMQAMDPRRGYVLGLLFLDGTITEAQHEAGIRYAEDMARYYGLTGVPFPSPRAQNLFAVRGEASESERSEEHTSELQSRRDIVSRLL